MPKIGSPQVILIENLKYSRKTQLIWKIIQLFHFFANNLVFQEVFCISSGKSFVIFASILINIDSMDFYLQFCLF